MTGHFCRSPFVCRSPFGMPSTGRRHGKETGYETNNSLIRLSLLPLLLPKMDRGGSIPLYARKPRRRNHERHSTTPTRKDWTRLLTIFIKIKAHRGDPLNKLADRWADEGRQIENIRWSLPTNRPIFNGTTHRSPMNPTVKKRIDLQVSQQQLKIHTGSTANFLIREDNSRDLLGKFHKDRSVWIRAKRRVLQCLSYQFTCALQLKQWGMLNEVKCRLCEIYYKEKNVRDHPDSVESVGHIQCSGMIGRIYNSHE